MYIVYVLNDVTKTITKTKKMTTTQIEKLSFEIAIIRDDMQRVITRDENANERDYVTCEFAMSTLNSCDEIEMIIRDDIQHTHAIA